MNPTADPMRVAAVDCGTNSIRLLIADDDGAGGLREIERHTEIVRLGQGVDATRRFHPDALARTFAATEVYAERIRAAGVPVERARFVATSASRDVVNRDEFFDGVRQRLGVRPDVITGDAEARLSYRGATAGVADPEPTLVMDLGGGSTELVLGQRHEVRHAISLDVGSVRITERFFSSDPPQPADLDRAAAFVDGLLDESGIPFEQVTTWVGVAGTVTQLAAVHLGLEAYDRSRVDQTRIPVTELDRLLGQLAGSDVETIKTLPAMHPGRADVITGGALVVSRVARRLGTDELVISESDILDGIALELLDR